MIGIVIVTHGSIASEFVRATHLIVGEQTLLEAVSLAPDEDIDSMKARIGDAIKKADAGDGVVVLTDMFGGTPSNLSLPFHREGRVEIVMGVNLPMLLKLSSERNVTEGEEKRSPAAVAAVAAEYGRKNIQVATEILKK